MCAIGRFCCFHVNPPGQRRALHLPNVWDICHVSRLPFVAHCEGSRLQGSHPVLLGIDRRIALQDGTCGKLGHCTGRTTTTVFLKESPQGGPETTRSAMQYGSCSIRCVRGCCGMVVHAVRAGALVCGQRLYLWSNLPVTVAPLQGRTLNSWFAVVVGTYEC